MSLFKPSVISKLVMSFCALLLAASPSWAEPKAIPTPTAATTTSGLNLLHHLSYDSSERKSESEAPTGSEVSSYGTGLDLSNTEVSDKDLAQLALPAFSKVQWLNLRGTGITDAGLEHLRNLPKLRTLLLESTEVTGENFRILKDLPLETLVLEDTKVGNAGLRNLAGCPVQTLNLTLTKVTDEGLRHLTRLPKLRSLNLYSTEITDAGLLYLYDLELHKLFLTGTQVTDPEVERMRFKFPDLLIIY